MPNVASLNVNITAGVANFAKGMNQAKGILNKFQAAITTFNAKTLVVGAAVGSIVAATKRFASAGDALDEMSTRTGIAVENLSSLQYAALFSSVGVDKLATAIARMQRSLATTPEAFTSLGLDPSTLAKASPDEQLAMIADALAAIEDPAKKTAAAMKLFGKGGAELIPFLDEGSAKIRELTAEAQELGVTMSGPQAKAAAALDDAYTRLGATWNKLLNSFGEVFAPVATQTSDLLADMLSGVNKLVDGFGKLQKNVEGAANSLLGLPLAGLDEPAFGRGLEVTGTLLKPDKAYKDRIAKEAAGKSALGALPGAIGDIFGNLVKGPAQGLQNLGVGINLLLGQATNKLANAPSAPGQAGQLSALGPSLIKAGSAEAFQLGRNDKDRAQQDTAKNTKEGTQHLADILRNIQEGLNIKDLQVIGAFGT